MSIDSSVSGISSSLMGSNTPPPGAVAPSSMSGLMVKGFEELTQAAMTKGINSIVNPRMNAKEAGKWQRDYLASAFPTMNPWETAGASATSAGVAAGEQINQARMQSAQLASTERIAKLNAATSRANTKDQVYAANEMLPYNQRISDVGVREGLERIRSSEQAKSALGRSYNDIKFLASEFGVDVPEFLQKHGQLVGGLLASGYVGKELINKIKIEMPKSSSDPYAEDKERRAEELHQFNLGKGKLGNTKTNSEIENLELRNEQLQRQLDEAGLGQDRTNYPKRPLKKPLKKSRWDIIDDDFIDAFIDVGRD